MNIKAGLKYARLQITGTDSAEGCAGMIYGCKAIEEKTAKRMGFLFL